MIEGTEVTSEWLNFENKIVPGINFKNYKIE